MFYRHSGFAIKFQKQQCRDEVILVKGTSLLQPLGTAASPSGSQLEIAPYFVYKRTFNIIPCFNGVVVTGTVSTETETILL